MSEPSPETKQAEEWRADGELLRIGKTVIGVGPMCAQLIADAHQQAIDAATAKLRHELGEVDAKRLQAEALYAKLRDELEIMTRSRDAWQETAARMTQNYADAKDKLAHQQPSDDVESVRFEQGKGRIETKRQQREIVEQLAREIAEHLVTANLIHKEERPRTASLLKPHLAPLVEAIEAALMQLETGWGYPGKAAETLRKAITGAGEK